MARVSLARFAKNGRSLSFFSPSHFIDFTSKGISISKSFLGEIS
jgi:hypothetical protein